MITLQFPPASLSGHAKGHWRVKAEITRKHRNWARLATMDAKVRGLPEAGDILIRVRFVPPDRRSDRTNFVNRCKPLFDGIADALGVNDARFLPSFEYADPEKPGRVEVAIGAVS
jgi:crossover junction endodeoxyribonuclease RusA